MERLRARLKRLLGRFFYTMVGWSMEPLPQYPGEKFVVVCFPHTSFLDGCLAFASMAALGREGNIIVKQEAFKGPLGLLLRLLGGIPVERGSSGALVSRMVREFRRRNRFFLGITPEGTRGRVDRLKSGFWHIAKQAEVPILCWYIDQEAHRTRWLGLVHPGDDIDEDLRSIRFIYEAAGCAWPSGPLPPAPVSP